VHKFADNFLAGFALLKNSKHYFLVLLETVILWLLYAGQLYLVLLAFHFDTEFPLIAVSPILAVFFMLIIDTIGISVPSAPGSVGTFHAMVVFGLSLFEVPPDAAVGFAIVQHAVYVIYYLIAGLPFLWREGLHFSQLGSLPIQSNSNNSNDIQH
jgi:uncharacterized membrane protein YbhN (UPF0104 family)